MTPERADRSSPAALERWAPGVGNFRRYDRRWLRSDAVAGIVLAAILVPQGMAYAELAGLPAVNGLYTTMACLVGYAIFGPSRILVLGPDSSLGPLIFAAIIPLTITGDPASLVVLAGMLALIVAAIEIGLGLGKLGFVADLLSKEVQVGYMIGLGITIIVGQLPKLFGFSTDANGFIHEVRAFFDGLDARNRDTLIVGCASLAVLLVLPRFTRRLPAVLITVILATLAVSLFDLKSHGVATVGSLPQGLPRPQIPTVNLTDFGVLLTAALGITFVSLADTIATSTSFAARRGDEVDASQEMIGIGAANAFAGLFQGFPISTSGSRTAVAEQSGAKSQLTGVIGAAVVASMLLFLPSLLANLPQSALAAIVIAAALSLMDFAIVTRFAPTAEIGLRAVDHRCARRDPLRRARGNRDRGCVVDPDLLQAELVAERSGPRPGRCTRLLAPHRRQSRCGAGSRRRGLSLGGAALLRQRRHLPAGDPPARRHVARLAGSSFSARPSRTSTSPQPTCSSDWTTSSTGGASTWCSSSYAAASTSWWRVTGCSTRWTRRTSTTRSTPRSPTSQVGTNDRSGECLLLTSGLSCARGRAGSTCRRARSRRRRRSP